MRKYSSLVLILALVPLLFTTGCKKDKEQTDFEILADYVTDNSLDLNNILEGWVTSGGGINIDATDYSVPDYYVMDFRKAEDFALGHVKDAHNVTLGNVFVEAEKANGQPILCVCYSGQTAARATGFLKMAGYSAKSLKWGMSSWHSDFAGKWDANATDIDSPNWATNGDPQPIEEFNTPTFSTGKSEGKDILIERINTALAFDWTISKTDVLGAPNNYFVNNKWPQASWDEYGHIDGAYRIDEDLLFAGLKNLNPEETVVTYCYTGQTSSITTAWLHVMGFDNAKSLLYGANGIIHSKMLTGTAGSAPAKSWKGAGSGSAFNYGYYNAAGDLVSPN